MLWYTLGGWIILLNLAGYVLMGVDKRRAKKRRRRIPERTLFMVSWLGGAVGSLLGMRVWRHKTQHRSFTVGIPLILLFHVALAVVVWLLCRG